MTDPAILDIADEVFDLFKKRTDGANKDIEDIQVNAVHDFHYQKKIPKGELFEAFRLLEKEDLIHPSSGYPSGERYRLSLKGQKTDLAEAIADRLRDKRSKMGGARLLGRIAYYLFPSSLGVTAIVVFWLGPAGFIPATSLTAVILFSPIVLSLMLLGFASRMLSMEDILFLRCFSSYEAIRKGDNDRAERVMNKVARALLNSKEGLAKTDWNVLEEEVYPVFSNLGKEIQGRLLQAIHSKKADTKLATVKLAKLFAYPSLGRFKGIISILDVFDKQEYKVPSRWEKLLTHLRVHTPLRMSIQVAVVFALAASLYFAFHLFSSIFTGVPFNLDVCIRDMFPYNFAIFLAVSAAIVFGLRGR